MEEKIKNRDWEWIFKYVKSCYDLTHPFGRFCAISCFNGQEPQFVNEYQYRLSFLLEKLK